MPKVSVIIPNYNHEQFLEQRLESVFSQSFQDFEVIFLDDCSTDNSLKVLDRFSTDSRLKVEINSANSGSPFKQWNRGMGLATGDYVWIAESDDFADNSFLKQLVDALENNPNAGLAYCQSWIARSDRSASVESILQAPYAGFADKERWTQSYKNSGISEITDYLIFNNTIANASSVVFRRSMVANGLRAPENMRLAGDWMFWIQILLKSELVFISEPLNYFREPHTESQRHKTNLDGSELLEGIDIYNFVAGQLPLEVRTKSKCFQERVKVWGTLMWNRRLDWETNREIFRKIAAAHPEMHWLKTLRILSLFALYYLSTPFRQRQSKNISKKAGA